MNRLCFAALALLAACAPATVAPSNGAINGTVTYAQRIALVPEASEVLVQLVDGTEAGGPVVAETRVSPEGQVPIAFTLEYEGASMQPDHHYYLRAAIIDRASGQATFATVHDIPVIPGMLNAVEVMVEPATGKAAQ